MHIPGLRNLTIDGVALPFSPNPPSRVVGELERDMTGMAAGSSTGIPVDGASSSLSSAKDATHGVAGASR